MEVRRKTSNIDHLLVGNFKSIQNKVAWAVEYGVFALMNMQQAHPFEERYPYKRIEIKALAPEHRGKTNISLAYASDGQYMIESAVSSLKDIFEHVGSAQVETKEELEFTGDQKVLTTRSEIDIPKIGGVAGMKVKFLARVSENPFENLAVQSVIIRIGDQMITIVPNLEPLLEEPFEMDNVQRVYDLTHFPNYTDAATVVKIKNQGYSLAYACKRYIDHTDIVLSWNGRRMVIMFPVPQVKNFYDETPKTMLEQLEIGEIPVIYKPVLFELGAHGLN